MGLNLPLYLITILQDDFMQQRNGRSLKSVPWKREENYHILSVSFRCFQKQLEQTE